MAPFVPWPPAVALVAPSLEPALAKCLGHQRYAATWKWWRRFWGFGDHVSQLHKIHGLL